MQENEQKTALGQYLDKILKGGEVATIGHSFDMDTIAKMAAAVIASAIIIFAIKKYIFKLS